MSNFAMGTILAKGFAQAQVHTNHSTSVEGTSAVMYACNPVTAGEDIQRKTDLTVKILSFFVAFLENMKCKST